jgi:hypothetical protein
VKSKGGKVTPGGGTGGGGTNLDGGGNGGGLVFNLDGGSATTLTVTPATTTITVNPAAGPLPTVPFTLHGNTGGEAPSWRVENPSLGYIDPNGVFTPTGTVGGVETIEAVVGNQKPTATVTINIAYQQNGNGATMTSTDAGAGGLGGVGGEGFGGPVDTGLIATLQGKPTADASLRMLYPYDQTVFPLDLPPPLFQWGAGSNGNFDAVYIHLSAPPYFDYQGTYGRPALLAAGANFLRHPIPADVWRAATLSSAGTTLSVEIVLAAGGKAYGPLKQTYNIALAPISGRVYYQAYATAFVHNIGTQTKWGTKFGGATLSIDVGADAPALVAGTNSDDQSGCRVCHSVSAYGDRMVVQHGDDYTRTSSYDLKNGNTESTPYPNGSAGWAGLYPDGTIGLANSINVTGSSSNTGNTALYDMATGAVIPSPGLSDFATHISLPAFSPDGKHAAFGLVDGPSNTTIGAPNKQLVVMDFDLATKTFSNPQLLWQGAGMASNERAAFTTFTPASDGVIFQRRWDGDNDYSSWHSAHSELWWVDLATKTATRLDAVNGVGVDGKTQYLPTGPNEHDQDQNLNYEPSISPVASGGYAWLVFMSRRLYGNVATSDPWHTDPRDYDTHVACPPPADDPDGCYATKKLWMAAIDLNPKPGKDPSHPAFYIPGQEIQGTNSRPFFALKPCVSDSGTCTTGVDCCNRFCRDGLCVPPPTDSCSQIDESCMTSSDCCPGSQAQCIGGVCAVMIH